MLTTLWMEYAWQIASQSGSFENLMTSVWKSSIYYKYREWNKLAIIYLTKIYVRYYSLNVHHHLVWCWKGAIKGYRRAPLLYVLLLPRATGQARCEITSSKYWFDGLFSSIKLYLYVRAYDKGSKLTDIDFVILFYGEF